MRAIRIRETGGPEVLRVENVTDFAAPLTVGDVPVNVALVCQWTWMCAPPPQGPNVHTNPSGAFVIALALLCVAHAVWDSRHRSGRDPAAVRNRERRGF